MKTVSICLQFYGLICKIESEGEEASYFYIIYLPISNQILLILSPKQILN